MNIVDLDQRAALKNYEGLAALETVHETREGVRQQRETQWLPCSEYVQDELRDFEDYPNIIDVFRRKKMYSVHVCSEEPILEYLCNIQM